MAETKILAGGPVVRDEYIVTTDQVTIRGDGTTERPLIAIAEAGGIALSDDGVEVPGGPFMGIDFTGSVNVTDAGGGVGTVEIGSGVSLEDDGTPLPGGLFGTVNFVGDGVSVADVAGVGTVTIPGGIAGIDVEDDGSAIGNFATLNFFGPGVVVTDDGGVGKVEIPGGISGVVVQDEGVPIGSFDTLDFSGPGLRALDAGGGTATVTATDAVSISTVQTADVVLGSAGGQIVRVDPTGGGFSVTLPAAASVLGQSVVVKNVSQSTNLVTLLPAGGDTIEGEASQVLSGDRFFCRLTSNGTTDWMITGA